MDLSIFLEAQTWVTMLTLIFLEIALGVDNLVFITITTDRLPPEKQHIGRKLGLLGALVMRIIFLSFASLLVHMTSPLFTIDLGFYAHGVSVRDLVLLIGGAYLLVKGVSEIRGMLGLEEERAKLSEHHEKARQIGLGRAIGTIMAMDVVFSIDSVITAVGLADHLIVMIIAVMLAVILMMLFIDQVSNFINSHAEIKILALSFIVAIGALLVTEGLGIATGIHVAGMELEKLLVYCALAFGLILELVQMRYNSNLKRFRAENGLGADGTPLATSTATTAATATTMADAPATAGDGARKA